MQEPRNFGDSCTLRFNRNINRMTLTASRQICVCGQKENFLLQSVVIKKEVGFFALVYCIIAVLLELF